MMKNNFMKKRCTYGTTISCRDSALRRISRFEISLYIAGSYIALYQADKQRGSMNRKLEGKEFERIVTSGARSETKFRKEKEEGGRRGSARTEGEERERVLSINQP